MKVVPLVSSGWKAVLALIASAASIAMAQETLVAYRIENEQIRAPLAADAGDAARGRAIVTARDSGNCHLCHAVPGVQAIFLGNLAPPLQGVGARLDAGKLRLRVVDSSKLNGDSIMPAYYRVDGLREVATTYRGKPILSAQQVEDVVAYLLTLH